MSCKDTKAAIKEIRESIKAENYGNAIHKCQLILKEDSKNYWAYLFLGAAYQNTDKAQAAKYLHKAVEYSPGAPTVALQGLATCVPTSELPQVYEKLLEFAPEKQTDYFEKLLAIAENESVIDDCFRVIKKVAKQQKCEESSVALEYLAKLWHRKDFTVANDEHELYKNAMELFARKADNHLQSTVYKNYIKWLYKYKDYAACVRNAVNVISLHPNEIYAYEWICKIYCENYQNEENSAWRDELKEPIERYVDLLHKIDEKSGLAMLIKGIDLYKTQQFVSARATFRQVQLTLPNYAVNVELLARTEMHLGAFKLALPMWELLNKQEELEYTECLSHEHDPEQLKKAIQLLEGIPASEARMNALARCYFKLGDLARLKALDLCNLSKAEFIMEPSEALKYIDTISEADTFDAFLLRGKLHLALGNNTEALTNVLKATRLKPYSAECFDYLGRVYYRTNDFVRARKCYEKCVNLNEICFDAVDNLSSMYQQAGEEELNEALLLNTLQHMKNDNAMRLQYRLGLHYLKIGKWDNAIQSFRTAIKYDVRCMLFWESLGDAYVARGSYNSAIRVFQKILEMSGDNIYAQLQIALIKTTIRMYPEAINDFEELLKRCPDYLPGLKGIAEAHLGLANNLKSTNFYGRAKYHLQQAVNYLQSVILSGVANEMVWLWRLMANIFVQTAQLPASIANLDVSGNLAKREEAIAFLTRKDLLFLARRFYTCALKLKQNTFLWYELALCSYYSAHYIAEEQQIHLELAEKACKMAIQEQSNRWQNWNLLGVINMHSAIDDLPLAQHCFIQALNFERKSFTSWTNLGVLYFKLNEIKLANQAFQRAQQSSPIYSNAWIGQAMIAEAIGEDEEAMDLFRHCQQFDYHAESALGYAHWVCTMLSSPILRALPHNKHAIEHMYADTVALDAIDWYVRNEESEATVSALTFQAFLCIRKKLHRLALKPLLQATKIASPGDERDKLYTNLGYLYLQLKEPERAINAFNMVGHVTFKPIIGLALAYYRSGQLQESYSVYNSVLNNIAGTEDDKAANILVAMASMVYEYQGETDTKTILYQCILLKDSPVQALYSACALGILHHDNQLTETILNELKIYDHTEEYCTDIAYLTAQYYLVNQQPRQALNSLLRRVHMFPRCATLRKLLAGFLLDNYGSDLSYQTLTSQMTLSALVLSHRHVKVKYDPTENVETLLIASRALKPVDSFGACKLIQRAMHLQPQNRHAWLHLLPTVV